MLLVKDQVLSMHVVKRHPVMAMMTHEVLAMRAFHVVLESADLGELRLGHGHAGWHWLVGSALCCHGRERRGDQPEGRRRYEEFAHCDLQLHFSRSTIKGGVDAHTCQSLRHLQ
jgi:hypothetical protein